MVKQRCMNHFSWQYMHNWHAWRAVSMPWSISCDGPSAGSVMQPLDMVISIMAVRALCALCTRYACHNDIFSIADTPGCV
jgi:hypothetical protein